ncbi:MAG: hypothetical protein ACYCSF_10760 [Acidimicrobiales bacterium]
MPSRRGSVVTIGAYDGLHLGHVRVIADVRRRALAAGLESVVVTFDRHPASIVRPESAPLQLTDLPQRLELLHATGIDDVTVIEFTPDRAAEAAEDFVDEVLVAQLAARVIVVGRDFHFGRGRSGNVALLEKMGESRGFCVAPFDLVADEETGEVVSSTRIRTLITECDLDGAARLLGRSHEVRGVVVTRTPPLLSEDEGSSSTVAIPREIILPPPGGYRGRAGPVGAREVPLPQCRVLVSSRPGTVVLSGLSDPWPVRSPVRVLFDAPASPE